MTTFELIILIVLYLFAFVYMMQAMGIYDEDNWVIKLLIFIACFPRNLCYGYLEETKRGGLNNEKGTIQQAEMAQEHDVPCDVKGRGCCRCGLPTIHNKHHL